MIPLVARCSMVRGRHGLGSALPVAGWERRALTGLLLIALFVPAAFAPSAGAATLTVSSSADSGAGSLREAISQANGSGSDDAIVFGAGLAGQTVTLTSGPLAVSKRLRAGRTRLRLGRIAGARLTSGRYEFRVNATDTSGQSAGDRHRSWLTDTSKPARRP
jgi:hypothetical protein